MPFLLAGASIRLSLAQGQSLLITSAVAPTVTYAGTSVAIPGYNKVSLDRRTLVHGPLPAAAEVEVVADASGHLDYEVSNGTANDVEPGMVVTLSAPEIASPTPDVLADLNATYRLETSPYNRYRSNGTALIDLGSNVAQDTSNRLLSGGGVAYVGSLTYRVAAGSARINNAITTWAQTDVTLATADPTDPRIDVIAIQSGTGPVVITGTPAANPAAPTVDLGTQLQLTIALLLAAATDPAVTTVDIYRENTEWTTSRSGTTNTLASASSPLSGSVSILGAAVTTGNYFQCQNGSPVDLANSDTLIFLIKSTAAWPATRSLTIQFGSGGTNLGTPVTFASGSYGFDSSDLTTVQQIVIPLSAFGANGLSVNRVRFTCAGSGATIGYRVDNIALQGGAEIVTDSARMRWRGAWTSTVLYQVNDVVKQSGGLYVAIATNTNADPTTATASWQVAMTPAAVDAELAAIAALTSAANKLPYFTGSGTAALADMTAFARTILDDADAAAVRATIGAGVGGGDFSSSVSSSVDGELVVMDGTSGKTGKSATTTGLLKATAGVLSAAVAGTDYIAADAELAAIAGLTSAADKGIQFTGSGTAATYDLTAAGKALLDDADATAQRATLGLVIGTNVQAYDAELAAIAGLTSAADKGIQFTGSGTAATYDLTTAGKALLDDADAAAQRATLSAAALSQVDQWSTFIASPSDKDYRVILDTKFGCTINEVTTRSASGTCTLTVKINTTALGGTANSVSSTESTQSHSSANVVATGDDIVFTVSSNSSCADMSVTIKYTRTLA